MNDLKKAVRDYVALRRSLGYKLQLTPRLLSEFASYLNEQGASYVTAPLAVQWALRNHETQPAEAARRLTQVRGFARFRSATDPRTQVPLWGLLPYRPKRARPYLYTDKETRNLLQAARELGGLRGLTYCCVFGLLAVAGLRVSEVFNLRPHDVDFKGGLLLIAGTKFGKSRLVPMHASTQKVMAHYARERDRAFRRNLDYFFVTQRGNRLDGGGTRRVFYKLSRQIGLRGATASRGPRLHDFRHRFALKTLIHWYRSGQQIEQRLPILSTFLGHVHVSDTYWYLTACPELMGLAVRRFERHWEEPA